MLRSFVAEQYGAAPLSETLSEAGDILTGAEPHARIRATLVPLLLPHLVEAVEHVIVAADDRPDVRGFAGGLLTYVYNPLDLLQGDGVLGWLDDAIVCALGLLKLTEEKKIELDDNTRAVVDVVTESLDALPADLRGAIENFIDSLWESGGQGLEAVRRS